jgi:cytochrome c5
MSQSEVNQMSNAKSLFFRGLFFSMLALATMTACASEEDPAVFDVVATYNKTCAVCHNSGAAGAPRKGSNAWAARLGKGEGVLLANTKNGIGAMPAKGLCQDCSDEQLKALIDYMIK